MSAIFPESVLMNPLLASEDVGWWTRLWFRAKASTFAGETDAIYNFIFWVSIAFFVVLMFLMVYWGIKYRRKPGVAPEISPSHNTPLEIVWTVVPTILLFVMFVWGFKGYLNKAVSPVDAEVIQVTAKKWNWTFEYKTGAKSRELDRMADMDVPVFALPLNRPVKFVMSSDDVIHSMFFPEFRAKRDVMPNRYTTMWVQPTGKPTHTVERYDNGKKLRLAPLDSAGNVITDMAERAGKGYNLFCTEYCGDQHSQMLARIAVLAEADYKDWLDYQGDTSGVPLNVLGEQLYKLQGCATCHSVNGAKGTGPTWKDIWGETHKSTTGASATVDENYIRESILVPGAFVREGFSNQMPSYQGKMKDREIRALTTYIMSLNDKFKQDAQAVSDEEMAKQQGGSGSTPAK
ncbi:MAG: cytochrome c oxidase subunit II [Planctomycetes bacterium]|nr:cytochrome c oxidase subunit II [Planctomycetota bacterium]